MQKNLNSIMKKRDIDAIIVTGSPTTSKDMYYFTGHLDVHFGILIKPRGKKPVFYYTPIERDEAKKAKCSVKSITELDVFKFLKKIKKPTYIDGQICHFEALIEKHKIKGNIAIYGNQNQSVSFPILTGLEKKIKKQGIFIAKEDMFNSLNEARMTKDEAEMDIIRHGAKLSAEVFKEVRKQLSSFKQKENFVVDNKGKKIKIGDIKRFIKTLSYERGLNLPEGFIFSQGYDSGVPHSTGQDDKYLLAGKTIIFDYYPSLGSGHFFDTTRTFCLGEPSEEAQAIFNDVLRIQKRVVKELKIGGWFHKYDELACELFEKSGHQTTRSKSRKQEGYCHTLGHGVGLNLHELPTIYHTRKMHKLKKGMVFTIEPGLYYPEKEIGVRIEDVIYVNPKGEIENLTKIPYTFIIPLKKYTR